MFVEVLGTLYRSSNAIIYENNSNVWIENISVNRVSAEGEFMIDC